MKKHFYTHLIEIESLIVELDQLELAEHEKHHLASLVDSNLHHTVLDTVLSQLEEEDKSIFIEHIKGDDHDKIWQFLNEKNPDIEAKIKKAIKEFIAEHQQDIKEARNK